jgi:hypothetical protein
VTHIELSSAVDGNRPSDLREVLGVVERPPTFPRGVCRRCGCSHFDPCMTPVGPCGWADRKRTLCTACEEL